jgi:hypothetical protein
MIVPTELTQNYERLNTSYDPNQLIETLFQQFQDARSFAVAKGQPYGDAMIVNVARKQLKDNMSNNGGNSVEWCTVGSKNKGNKDGVQAGTKSGESGGSPMQVEAMTLKNGGISGRTNATVTNDSNAADGMKTYNAKTGFIEVIFMTGNIKGFNVSRALKQFLAAAREQDNEFTILPLLGIGNNLCVSANVPNTKD